MLPLLPSRPREVFSLLTGVPLDSRLVSTINLLLLYLEVILPRYREQSVCCPTLQPLLKPGLDLITSLISCTPSVPLFTGMLVKVWRRESSLKQEKIWLLLRKIMKKLELILVMLRREMEMNIKEMILQTK